MTVTINTDASYSYTRKIGTYAFLIWYGETECRAVGKVPVANNPWIAEMYGIHQAVIAVRLSGISVSELKICCDNQTCLETLLIKGGRSGLAKAAYTTIKQVMRRHGLKEVEIMKVKAHEDNGHAYSWANNECDMMAKEALRGLKSLSVANSERPRFRDLGL